MPTYDYECTHCGNALEVFQQINDKVLDKCPKCGKKLKRLIGSGGGIIFKGPGFYATDYRKKSGKEPEKVCPKTTAEGCKGCPQAPQAQSG